MKKLLAFVLIVVFCVSLAACQVTTEEPSSIPEESSSESVSQEPSSEPDTSDYNPEDVVSEPVSQEPTPFVEQDCVNWKQSHNGVSGGMSPYHYILKPTAVIGDGVFDHMELDEEFEAAITKQISEYNNSVLDDQTDNPPYDLPKQLEMYGISKEEFIKMNDAVVECLGGEEYRPFTSEEVDLIYGDHNAFLEYFKSDKALYHNGRIYSPAWFAKHPLEDWEKEGFSKQALKDYFTEAILEMYWDENKVVVTARLEAYPED